MGIIDKIEAEMSDWRSSWDVVPHNVKPEFHTKLKGWAKDKKSKIEAHAEGKAELKDSGFPGRVYAYLMYVQKGTLTDKQVVDPEAGKNPFEAPSDDGLDDLPEVEAEFDEAEVNPPADESDDDEVEVEEDEPEEKPAKTRKKGQGRGKAAGKDNSGKLSRAQEVMADAIYTQAVAIAIATGEANDYEAMLEAAREAAKLAK